MHISPHLSFKYHYTTSFKIKIWKFDIILSHIIDYTLHFLSCSFSPEVSNYFLLFFPHSKRSVNLSLKLPNRATKSSLRSFLSCPSSSFSMAHDHCSQDRNQTSVSMIWSQLHLPGPFYKGLPFFMWQWQQLTLSPCLVPVGLVFLGLSSHSWC